MATFKSHLRFVQGDTFAKRYTYKTGDTGEETPVNFTGCTARAQIRASVTATTALATLTTENGGITLGGVAGTIDLLIEDTETTEMTFKQAVWDLEIIFANGHKRTLISGNVYVTPGVTQ